MAKKLRILCFHGYNNTAEIMEFQMKNFVSTTAALCEYTFIEGANLARETPD